MSFVDKTLTCRDCSAEFVFTVGEQEFFAEKGFTNEPTRCMNCRRERKSRMNTSSGYGNGGGGGYSSSASSYSRTDRQMYPAVCSECGKDTEVPFEPRNDKPVYCNDCFRSRRQPRSFSSW